MYIPAVRTIQLHDVVEQGIVYSSSIYVYTCSADHISAKCSRVGQSIFQLYIYIPAVQTLYLIYVVEQGRVYFGSIYIYIYLQYRQYICQMQYKHGRVYSSSIYVYTCSADHISARCSRAGHSIFQVCCCKLHGCPPTYGYPKKV